MKHEFYLGSKKGKVELEVVDKTSKKQSSGRMAYTLVGANGDKLVKATVSEEKWDSFNIEKRRGKIEIGENDDPVLLSEAMVKHTDKLEKENEAQKVQIQSFVEALKLIEAENDRLKEVVKELEDSNVSSGNTLKIPKDSVFTKIEDGFYGYQIGTRGILFRSAEGLEFIEKAQFAGTEKLSIR